MSKFRSFTLSGTVTPYTGNGRKMGFPTANIPIPTNTPEGLFLGHVKLEKKDWPALIFIGAPITLNDPLKRAEAFVLDFKDRDLYGEKVVYKIEFKLRENVKYEGVPQLIKQMKKDEIDAREYFAKT